MRKKKGGREGEGGKGEREKEEERDNIWKELILRGRGPHFHSTFCSATHLALIVAVRHPGITGRA